MIEEMFGGQHRIDERKQAEQQGDTEEQKRQTETQFVRRRRGVLESSEMHQKKPLQRPASLEIARYSGLCSLEQKLISVCQVFDGRRSPESQ